MSSKRLQRRRRYDSDGSDDSDADAEIFLADRSNSKLMRFGGGIYYFCLHVALSSVLALQDTALHKNIIEGNMWYPLTFFGLMGVTFGFYLRAALMDPGFVEIDDQTSDGDSYKDVPLIEITQMEGSSSPNQGSNRNLISPPSHLPICDICEIRRPVRARHCRLCGRCVRRFDHHCGWLGQCVGEKNHFWFWWFLLFQSIITVWAAGMGLGGTYNFLTKSTNWFSIDAIIFVSTVVLVFLAFAPVSLLSLHTYLAITNQTSWESFRPKKIPYLRGLASTAMPFDRGLMRNIYYFCCDFRRNHAWDSFLQKTSDNIIHIV